MRIVSCKSDRFKGNISAETSVIEVGRSCNEDRLNTAACILVRLHE